MVKDDEFEVEEDVEEIDTDKAAADLAVAIDENEIEDEGGIFDDDFAVIEEEGPSDFSISGTMLSTAAPVESWSGQNLEETISRERVERDWGDEEEFFGGDFYKASEKSSGGDFYGAARGGSDFYGAAGGAESDLYRSAGGAGDGVYVTGGKGSVGDDAKVYNPSGKNFEGYDEMRGKRGKGRSMLEIAGFEDKEKERHQDMRSEFQQYQAKKAA